MSGFIVVLRLCRAMRAQRSVKEYMMAWPDFAGAATADLVGIDSESVDAHRAPRGGSRETVPQWPCAASARRAASESLHRAYWLVTTGPRDQFVYSGTNQAKHQIHEAQPDNDIQDSTHSQHDRHTPVKGQPVSSSSDRASTTKPKPACRRYFQKCGWRERSLDSGSWRNCLAAPANEPAARFEDAADPAHYGSVSRKPLTVGRFF